MTDTLSWRGLDRVAKQAEIEAARLAAENQKAKVDRPFEPSVIFEPKANVLNVRFAPGGDFHVLSDCFQILLDGGGRILGAKVKEVATIYSRLRRTHNAPVTLTSLLSEIYRIDTERIQGLRDPGWLPTELSRMYFSELQFWAEKTGVTIKC